MDAARRNFLRAAGLPDPSGVSIAIIVLIGLGAAVVCLWDARRLKEVAHERLKHPRTLRPETAALAAIV
jgi:hypothetical protein